MGSKEALKTGWNRKLMRSSKSRSRSKNNRSRSVGNIVNRVFDSSGPEGKVRGTPQQIIDKYNQLARDAQLGNDRVAAENFQQHAEHYTRLLSEAQREQEARREQQEAQNRERQQQRNEQNQNHQQGGRPDGEGDQGDQGVKSKPDEADVIVLEGEDSSGGLVETPEESAPKPKPRAPRRRKPAAETAEAGDDAPKDSPTPAAE